MKPRERCWKCGSVLHDSGDCGVTLTDIRTGKRKPKIVKKALYKAHRRRDSKT